MSSDEATAKESQKSGAVERRILISGEGQESTLLAYFLARDQRLRQLPVVPQIYLFQSLKKLVYEGEDGAPTLLPSKFWMEYMTNEYSSKIHELSFWKYVSLARPWLMKSELDFVPPREWLITWMQQHPDRGSQDVLNHLEVKTLPKVADSESEAKITFKDGLFYAQGQDDKSIGDELAKSDQVIMIDGKVQGVYGFGASGVSHCDVSSSKVKSMKADTFVLCTSYFFLTQLQELNLTAPMIRCATDLVGRKQEKVQADILKGSSLLLLQRVHQLKCLNGLSSFLTIDGLPIVGQSSRFSNLFFLTGFSSTNIEFRSQVVRILAEQIIQHEIEQQSNNDQGEGNKVQSIVPDFNPARFRI